MKPLNTLSQKTFYRLLGLLLALPCASLVTNQGQAATLDPGYRALDAENTLVIDTSRGRVVVEMYPQLAPSHVERMKTLARKHFYDNQKFHRVIEGFMAQTGDPTGTGEGGSDLPNLNAEFSIRRGSDFPLAVTAKPVDMVYGYLAAMPMASQTDDLMAITKDAKVPAWGEFCQGVLGMARAGDANSANSQFFLMRGANSNLERKYTAFGAVVSGLDVVKKLKIGEPPKDPDMMLKVQVLADMPEKDRPNIEVMDTKSTEFMTLVTLAKKRLGDNITSCDVSVPSKILP